MYYQGDTGLRGPVGETGHGLPGTKGIKGKQGDAVTNNFKIE